MMPSTWRDYRCNLQKLCGKGPKSGCIFTDYDDGFGVSIGVRNSGCEMPVELIFSNVRRV